VGCQDDQTSLHQGKETKEILNAACVAVTITDANLRWPANSADLNPIE
jgi:hypothetical protein